MSSERKTLLKPFPNDGLPAAVTVTKEDRLLFQLHLVAAVVHGSQAIVLLALAGPDHRVDTIGAVHNAWTPGGTTIGYDISTTIQIEYLVPVFFLLAALDHSIVLLLLAYDPKEMMIASGSKTLSWVYLMPWFEYFISASIMNLLILILCNGLDLLQQFSVFMLTAITMTAGILHETIQYHVQDGSKRQTLQRYVFFIGCLPFIAAWVVILTNLSWITVTPPAFVYAVVATMLLLQSAFAVNQYIHIQLQNRFFYELGKIILSLTSKTLLAWLAYGGAQNIGRASS